MLETILLAATDYAVGIIKPILPDTREFTGNTGINRRAGAADGLRNSLPAIRILANCVEDTVLDRATLTELTQIIDQKAYPFAESISLSLLKTAVPKLKYLKMVMHRDNRCIIV